jgi:ElaB/YqjD/DUF883 family membrane-anchored ribosome-binding protein
MKSSERLELETEEARARVTNTLEELRARATPGQLVDQVIDYARDSSGGAFFNNLGRQVVDNPLPIALLGMSVAWLAIASGRPTRRVQLPDGGSLRDASERAAAVGENLAETARSTVSDFADRTKASASAVAESLSETGSRIGNAARSATGAIDSIRERASNTYETAAVAARRAASSVSGSSPAIRRNVARAGQDFVALCKEQPIALAGIGLALGAIFGALLPTSAAENRLLGEASDEVKARARHLSDKVKEGALATYDEMKDAAADVATGTASSSAASGHA